MSSKSILKKISSFFDVKKKKKPPESSFNLRQQQEGAWDAVERGTLMVPLEQIVGSVGRYHDFDREFKVRRHSQQRSERLEGILRAMRNGRALPPIALYQIKDDFYILDGHHRYQAARELGCKEILSRIVELLPSDNSMESILYREKGEFKEKYRLPKTIDLTEPGQFARFDWQIAEHQKHLVSSEKWGNNIEEAARDWYDTIYLPLNALVERSGLLEAFPQRTSADLCLYISTHQWQLGRTRKYGIKFDKLIPTDMEAFRMDMMNRSEQDYPEMKREITVFMLLNIEGKEEEELLRRMKELDEIREIHTVHGSFDLLIRITLHRDLLSSDAELISQFTQETIRQWPGVTSTQTLIPGMSIIKGEN
jgi:DNA-binding Lrp family transcriptional regulator